MRTLIIFMSAIVWLVASASAFADPHPLRDFAGRWAIKAEGRNLVVLALDYDASAHQLRGRMYRPTKMSLSVNTAASISLPVVEELLIGADINGDGLRIRFRDDKGIVTEWQFTPHGAAMATLKLTNTTTKLPPGFPALVYPLLRVGADVSVSADWDAVRVYTIDQLGEATDNANLTQLFDTDQAVRKSSQPIDAQKLMQGDAERRRAIAEMLKRGELHTGLDFLHAALVFQHGEHPADYLLAHALAVSALAKGRADAAWLAAATLDRYLQSVGQPQIYGTQFRTDKQNPQDPYDRDLLPDALRLPMGVPAMADQHMPTPILMTGLGPVCESIPGESALWSNPKIHFVMFGEMHGTNEEPALFGDAACAAYASGRPVIVAVEAAEDQQPAIDAFLASDGGQAAMETFLRSDLWHNWKDGRSSRAYFALFVRLRLLHKAGRIAGVVGMQPTLILSKPGFLSEPQTDKNNDLNAAMADRIRKAASLRPDALVLVLVGNAHASRTPITIGAQKIVPAAADLPLDETLTLRFLTDGEAWNCQRDVCGVHSGNDAQPMRREIRLGLGAPPGFDGVIDPGTKTTASLPAAK